MELKLAATAAARNANENVHCFQSAEKHHAERNKIAQRTLRLKAQETGHE
jgi:hypothetical protein